MLLHKLNHIKQQYSQESQLITDSRRLDIVADLVKNYEKTVKTVLRFFQNYDDKKIVDDRILLSAVRDTELGIGIHNRNNFHFAKVNSQNN